MDSGYARAHRYLAIAYRRLALTMAYKYYVKDAKDFKCAEIAKYMRLAISHHQKSIYLEEDSNNRKMWTISYYQTMASFLNPILKNDDSSVFDKSINNITIDDIDSAVESYVAGISANDHDRMSYYVLHVNCLVKMHKDVDYIAYKAWLQAVKACFGVEPGVIANATLIDIITHLCYYCYVLISASVSVDINKYHKCNKILKKYDKYVKQQYWYPHYIELSGNDIVANYK